jgi:predicted DNA-binding transcriptional regulator AlpA
MPAMQKGRPETTADEKRSLDRLIFRSELIETVGLSYGTIWSRMRACAFPRGRDIGGRTAWLESEVKAWIASRPIRRLKGDEGSEPIDSNALARQLHQCFSQVTVPSAKKRVGRPPVVDWTVVERETLRLMDYYGDFGADSPQWNVQARLEEALEEFCDSKFKKRPAKSTFQEHFKPWLEEWRAAKARPPET